MVNPGNAISAQALGDCSAEARSAHSKISKFEFRNSNFLCDLCTTILENSRSLRKFYGSRRLSDSDMPPAKAQRRQVRKDKKNILTKDFHVFSPTFAALASLREIFRVSVTVVRRRRTSFSQRSLGKSV